MDYSVEVVKGQEDRMVQVLFLSVPKQDRFVWVRTSWYRKE